MNQETPTVGRTCRKHPERAAYGCKGRACIECDRARKQAWGVATSQNKLRNERYAANRDSERAKQRARYAENPDVRQKAIAYAKKWSSENPDKVRDRDLQKAYGINIADYEVLLKGQGGVCAICGGPPSGRGKSHGYFQVDHDHKTQKVRGLLCGHCNLALGHAKDSSTILQNMINYLNHGAV